MSIKGKETFDHEKIKFNLAKLKKGGINFEIAVDPDLAISFRNGKVIDIKEIIKSDKIFSDVKKGVFAPETQMKQLFNTDDPLKVAKILLKEGEIQLTEEYRAKIRAEKVKKIIEIIHIGAVDPKTKLPHPTQRIENAMEEVKVHIDDFKTAEDQVESVVKKIRAVLPLSFETRKIMVKFTPEYAGKAYALVSSFGKPQEEDWKSNGAYVCTIEIPAGRELDFYDKLNNATKGTVETTVVK